MDDRIHTSIIGFWTNLSIVIFVILTGLNYYLFTFITDFLIILTNWTSFIILIMVVLIFRTLTITLAGKLIAITSLLVALLTLLFFNYDQPKEYMSFSLLGALNLFGGIFIFILGIFRKRSKNN